MFRWEFVDNKIFVIYVIRESHVQKHLEFLRTEKSFQVQRTWWPSSLGLQVYFQSLIFVEGDM